MEKVFALEVLPDEIDLEVVGDVGDDGFIVESSEDVLDRPGEDNEIIRDRRH